MWSLIKVNRTGLLLWISSQGTWNNKLCTFIKHVANKGDL